MSEIIVHACVHSACERAEWRHRNERHICSNVKTNNVSSKSVPNAGGRFLEKPGAADSALLKSSSSAAVTGGTLPVAVGAQSGGECTGAASHASDCSKPNGCTPSAGPGKSAQPATKQKELSGNGSKGAKGKKVTQSDHHEHHHHQQQQQQEQPQPQASSARLWWGSSPELSQRVPLLLKQKRWEEAQALLTLSADETAAETQCAPRVPTHEMHPDPHMKASCVLHQKPTQGSPEFRSLHFSPETNPRFARISLPAFFARDQPKVRPNFARISPEFHPNSTRIPSDVHPISICYLPDVPPILPRYSSKCHIMFWLVVSEPDIEPDTRVLIWREGGREGGRGTEGEREGGGEESERGERELLPNIATAVSARFFLGICVGQIHGEVRSRGRVLRLGAHLTKW
eukprot:5461474-Pleurochrysis_carterae.AAC.1